jgi:DNA-binding response OmpR family regulator
MPTTLIVEDDLPLARLLGHAMGRQGIDTICVASAEEATLELAQKSIDRALIDITLPGSSGFYVIEAIRKMPKDRRPSVVLITGSRANVLDKVDRSIVKAVLFKPLDVTALAAYVAAL